MIIKIESPKYGAKEVLIDDEDFVKVGNFKWGIVKGHKVDIFYCVASIKNGSKRKNVRMHRIIMNASIGYEVDHKNRNGLDNRKHNLRLCTQMQNQQNQKKRIDNKSGYKGVSFNKKVNKWQASIRINGKKNMLGCFSDRKIAYEAYCEASRKYHGEFGRIA